MLFKNKHVVVALLVTPLLAVIAYFATDLVVSEKPQKAATGTNYKMLERPNCRYSSGQCELRNGNFRITITPEILQDGRAVLKLVSNFDLQGVKMAVLRNSESDPLPVDMTAEAGSTTNWTITLQQSVTEGSRIQYVIAANDSLYYADTSTAFFKDDRAFKPDSR